MLYVSAGITTKEADKVEYDVLTVLERTFCFIITINGYPLSQELYNLFRRLPPTFSGPNGARP